jgi:ATP-dependent helicase/nuclease subunit A
MVMAVTQSAIWQRARRSRRQLVEVPFQLVDRHEEVPDPLPTVIRGVIDLAFQEGDGWVIVDYKTDAARGRALSKLVARYAPQLRLYAEAWRRCTGEPVDEVGLFFTRSGKYWPLADC